MSGMSAEPKTIGGYTERVTLASLNILRCINKQTFFKPYEHRGKFLYHFKWALISPIVAPPLYMFTTVVVALEACYKLIQSVLNLSHWQLNDFKQNINHAATSAVCALLTPPLAIIFPILSLVRILTRSYATFFSRDEEVEDKGEHLTPIEPS